MMIAIAQIAPVWLDRKRTIENVVRAVHAAADRGARLVCFGECLIPGYPAWLSRTDGARFDAPDQKELHAIYLDQAVDIEGGALRAVCESARSRSIAVVVGVAERPTDRGGHSVFCSAVTLAPDGSIASVHRKLMPTYEERLAWAHGDGHGLRAHTFLEPFTIGTLNCWENWMPLARASLYAQGVDVHVAIWPGRDANTRDITRFIAREGRSYVISASSLLRPEDIPSSVPHRDRILASSETPADGILHNGGSCIAAPDGSWLVEPVLDEQQVILAEIDHAMVRRERQNFDPCGHYSRPDILRLSVNRRRQRAAEFQDGPDATT